MQRRDNRSSRYQYLFLESSCPTEILETFSAEDSIYKRLDPFDYNDRVLDLEEELRVEFWRLVNSSLTERQRSVIELYVKGLTQCEIARCLDVNQSSITKSLNGNVDYKNSDGKVSYGGSLRKLRSLVEEDEKIKEILQKISDIRNETWM
jgi:DNA-binding CsgD family transcriptional regulator